MARDAEEQAGALDERVTLELWQSVRGEAGDDVGAWQRLDTAYAAIAPDGGPPAARTGEVLRSGRRWRVQLRDRAELGLTLRLRWRDQILSVRAVERDPRGQQLTTLWCDGSPA